MILKFQMLVLAFGMLAPGAKAQADLPGKKITPAQEKVKENAARADVYIVNKSIGENISDREPAVPGKPITTNKKYYTKKHKKKYCRHR